MCHCSSFPTAAVPGRGLSTNNGRILDSDTVVGDGYHGEDHHLPRWAAPGLSICLVHM